MNDITIDDELIARLNASLEEVKSNAAAFIRELMDDKPLRESAVAVLKISRTGLEQRIKTAQWRESGRKAFTGELNGLLSSKQNIFDELTGSVERTAREKKEAHISAIHKASCVSVAAREIALNSAREKLSLLSLNYKESKLSFKGIAATLERTVAAAESKSRNIPAGVEEAQTAALKELKIAAADSALSRKEEERRL